MNELQIFNNPEFGELRTFVEPDGTVLFCGADVSVKLGYKDKNDAIKRHCKGAVKRRTPTSSGFQDMVFVPTGDIYRLAARSQLPGAERFESWIFDEVIPSVHRTGTYSVQTTTPAELMLQQAKIMVDMEKKLTVLQAETESTRRKVDALSDSPAYWRSETDRKIKEIASRNRMAERLFRRDLYAELERVTGYDLENRLTRLRNRAKKQGALHTACNAMTRLDVIAQNKELRQEFGRLLGQYDTQIEWRA